MTTYTKQYYSIGEVSRLLDVPISTLRFWETCFPMFNPNRSPKGTRRFTPGDVELAEYIKDVLYGKGMAIDKAVGFVNKYYRRSPPRGLRKCTSPDYAITLLSEVETTLDDTHSIAKIESVIRWIKATMGDNENAD